MRFDAFRSPAVGQVDPGGKVGRRGRERPRPARGPRRGSRAMSMAIRRGVDVMTGPRYGWCPGPTTLPRLGLQPPRGNARDDRESRVGAGRDGSAAVKRRSLRKAGSATERASGPVRLRRCRRGRRRSPRARWSRRTQPRYRGDQVELEDTYEEPVQAPHDHEKERERLEVLHRESQLLLGPGAWLSTHCIGSSKITLRAITLSTLCLVIS